MHKFTVLLFLIGMFICMADADDMAIFFLSKVLGIIFCAPLVIELILLKKKGKLE